MDSKRAHNDLTALLVPLHGVESVLTNFAHEIDGAVALPVSSNNVLSLDGLFDHLSYSLFLIT